MRDVGVATNQIPSMESFSVSNTATAIGWQKLPSGLIVQWGAVNSVGVANNGFYNHVLTYAIAFPWGGASLVITPWSNSITASFGHTGRNNKAGCTLTSTMQNISYDWLAIGY